ncbi:MAG TPA: peptidoglycan-associated lipoprotein Pal [Rhodocyclaceae bacterium]
MQRTLIAAAVCGLLAACSSTPQKTAEAPAPKAAADTRSVGETDAQRIDRIMKMLATNSIYFDYDNYTVKPQYAAQLKSDFEALNSMPSLALRLEGNADERGSTEYNLALGQKRAEAVRRALVMMGVPEARLEAVSYGKEKPRATCHEEKCWAEDRRVDFAQKQANAAR